MRLNRLWRRERVPDDVRQSLQLAPGERVLAACRSGTTGYLVATDRALHIAANGSAERLRWDLFEQARWEPPLLVVNLRVESADARPTGAEQRRLPADITSNLPAVVRDRVTNSIVVNVEFAVPGGTARVVARRNSDTAQREWHVVAGRGVDLCDPAVVARIDAELADVRSRLGV